MFSNIKMEPNQGRENESLLYKKIKCPDHKGKYVFHCEHIGCQDPYMCSSPECLDKHFHEENKIRMTKFKTNELANIFSEIQSLIQDDTLTENAKIVKNYIDDMKDSIKIVYNGIRQINQNYDFFKGNADSPLCKDFLDRIYENNFILKSTQDQLDKLKEKTKLQFPIKDSLFLMRGKLGEFLHNNLHEFSWNKCIEVWNSKKKISSPEEFHEKVEGYSNLIFVFIGNDTIVGSYYKQSYPSLFESEKRDENAFLFMGSYALTKIMKVQMNLFSQSHIRVSKKNYIDHGNDDGRGSLKIADKNFDKVQFQFPDEALTNLGNKQELKGEITVEKFMILKLKWEKLGAKANEEEA